MYFIFRFATYDSTICLLGALFVNSAILILAAATFNKNGYENVATLEEAYQLLTPLLGSKAGSVLFGVALLASGLNATLTGDKNIHLDRVMKIFNVVQLILPWILNVHEWL
jgi:Mn2+/Fe2+ NRAMP family transporter